MVSGIESGNLKLAYFLFGEQANPKDREPEWYYGPLPIVNDDGEYESLDVITSHNLQFDCDWTWLMKVIEKMNDCSLWETYNILDLSIFLVSGDIESAWGECVAFVEEYNSQQSQK